MKRLLIVLSALILAPSAFAADSGLAKKAKAEGQVSFYANMTAIQPIMDVFNTQTGLKGKYTRISTSKFLPTVLTEFQAGKLMADVLQAPLPVMQMLKAKGVLAPYTSPAAASYPAWTRKDNQIQTFGIEYVGLIYNKELVKPNDVPKRYEDLTDPKWKNKIVMANPGAHATTISWLVGLKENVFKSETEWMQFLKGLAANRPMLVKSFGPTPAPVESGEKHIAISMPKYIITKAPAPLDWARVEQPLMGTPRGIAISSSAKNPNAAKLFVDFWLTKPAMGKLSTEVGEYVLAPGVFPPIDGMAKAEVIPIRTLSEKEIGSYGAMFKKIFELP
ncbi:MAG: extracellular solute-binding protein [Desulfosarcina sp.]|nr:extracellular solute-binding protein [Desulfosarcina sp.]MBC2742150.1 extracellular solute-binding protein [Desulfosarcina sp.]MBC2765062.1 extracellular solute-binding protein [Desulfosarcina sp.]